ncbi:MAG: ATP synthase subunit I [Pseudomonadota bacterium]
MRAASRVYRASLGSLAFLLLLSAAVAGFRSPGDGLATLTGGLIAWLPHLLMTSKVFGITRKGVQPVTLGGLMRAEALKLGLTAALFALAFFWLPASTAPWLFAGFIATLLANLLSVGKVMASMDAERAAKAAEVKDKAEPAGQ